MVLLVMLLYERTRINLHHVSGAFLMLTQCAFPSLRLLPEQQLKATTAISCFFTLGEFKMHFSRTT